MQRAGGSILTAAGLEELIADSFEEYVDIGVRLGADKVYYGGIKQRLNDSISGSSNAILFQPEVSVAAMVRGMRQAYVIWKNGHQPRALLVDQDENMPLEKGKLDEL